MNPSEFLKWMLEHCGQTQTQVCEAIEISQSALSHVIRGRSDPQLNTFVALGEPLGYQITITTKDNAYVLNVKGDEIELSDKTVRSQMTRLERLANFYSSKLSPKEIDDLAHTLEVYAEVKAREQKKRMSKTG